MSNYISAYDRFDDRAANGAVFTCDRNAYHRGRFGEFYFLKEKAKALLTDVECNYLFNGEMDNPNSWWDISHNVHTELDLQCNSFEFRKNLHFDDMEKITKSQWKNMYVCLGCSFTYGVGIPLFTTWPSALEERTGIKTLNLGVPGGSIQTSYRILDSWLKHFGCAPKAVLILGWLHPRIEMSVKGTPGHSKQNYDRYGTIILQNNTQSLGLLGAKVNHDHQKRLLTEDKTREIFRHTISNFAKLKNNYNLKMYRIGTTGMINDMFTSPSYADKQLFQGPKSPLLRLKGVAYDMSHPSPHYMTSTALAFMRLIEEKDEFLV